ncbi:T6SS amidase immunity protein Tai4 family protein [Denitromonas sp.]|uniref:T6SS amidase immunity protein Tai4 family protein n=1 Tax=Denitromonas sp. TaxID=2734609 RepID=UPI002B001928|nr:T6SS amidase immunity protein Tai4 family protein [Denitromonas sp.]
MKHAAIVLAALAVPACATDTSSEAMPQTARYSQRELLKNWALSACLATIAKSPADRDDANATASAYLEFGNQPIEAYQALGKLVERYAGRTYSGSIASEFNTMKCIDLYHSKTLEDLVETWVKQAP